MAQSDLIGWLLIIIMITCATATLIALRKISQYLDNEALADQNRDDTIEALTELHYWLNEKLRRYNTIIKNLEDELAETKTKEHAEPPHELIITIEQYQGTINELTTVHDTIKNLLDNQQ